MLFGAPDLGYKVAFTSKEADCEVGYDESLNQEAFMKSFETGLRDDILAANLRPILRHSTLTYEDLSKVALRQEERYIKLLIKEQSAKANLCGIEETKVISKKIVDESKQILVKIREIRSKTESVKLQQASKYQATLFYMWKI